ncbi:hypothetical protein ACFC1R_18030 [Kitasatospora sp. NPDC056138]|uniref:hypothetical protein n=1 Tax=Kitasatospora sp. NPDC056138 TaxID=3345724 RepID=UPI0035DA874A
MSLRIRPSALDNGAWLQLRESWATRWDSLAVHARARRYERADLAACCLFIGHPRSGHSAVGSVLDAHPDALVAHRLDAMRYIERGYSPAMLTGMITGNVRRFTRGGRRLTGYSYAMPGSWQGRTRNLRVIGDQEGRLTALRLARNPAALDAFERRWGVPVRLVHVTRNPYDNITTWALRRMSDLESTTAAYFAICREVASIAERRGGAGVLHVRHEEFLARPRELTAELCEFVGLQADREHLDQAVGLLYPTPHRSRHAQQWPPHLIARVAREAKAFAFLDGYHWDN